MAGEINESAPRPDIPSEPVDTRKTWTEVHGRNPKKEGGSVLGHAERYAVNVATKLEDDPLKTGIKNHVARIMMKWRPEPKSGDEIKVTPTQLKEHPLLTSEEDRKEVIKRALDMAVGNMRLDERGGGRPMVGHTTHNLSIITEVFKMTPEEIEKDGEALSELVEYLEQAAYRQGTDPHGAKITSMGSSKYQSRPPEPDDLFDVTARQIKETWDFPDDKVGRDYMIKRVNYNQNQPPPKE